MDATTIGMWNEIASITGVSSKPWDRGKLDVDTINWPQK